jgi:hypothetical protein
MKYGSADFALLAVDGVDLLPAKLQTFVERREAVMERVDGLGDKREANGPTGLAKISIVQTGAFFDDRQNGMHQAFKTDGRSRSMMYSFDAGKTVTSIVGVYRQSYEVVAQQGRLTRANVAYQVNGSPTDNGTLVQPFQTYTAAWDTKATPKDLGATVYTDASITVLVSAMVGFTSLGLSLLHSTDGIVWTTLRALPAITSAPSTVTVANLGPPNRYLAVSGTPVGAGSVTVAVIVTPI